MTYMTKEDFVEEFVEAVYADRDMLCVIWDDKTQQVEVTVGWDYSPKNCASDIKEYMDEDTTYEDICDIYIDSIRECAKDYYKKYMSHLDD